MVRKYFWKVIFVLYFLFAVYVLYDYVKAFPNFSFRDIRDLVIFSISVVGLFIYAFQKRLFTKKFWKVFFWIFVIDFILTIIYLFPAAQKNGIFNFF